MEDNIPVQDNVEPCKMGKFDIFLSEDDKKVWEKLTRNERRKRTLYQQSLIKKGILFQVKDEKGKVIGLIWKKEAIEKKLV